MINFKELLNTQIFKQKNSNDSIALRRNLLSHLDSSRETIKGETFNSETYMNITFENVDFYNCKFGNCSFQDVKFIDCSFIGCSFFTTNFNKCITDYTLKFMSCSFSLVKFSESILHGILICDSMFYIVEFHDTHLASSIFDRDAYFKTQFYNNCNLNGVTISPVINWMDIQFVNETSFVKVNSQTVIGKFDEKDTLYESDFNNMITSKNKYSYIANSYRSFYKQFKMNNENNYDEFFLYNASNYEAKCKSGVSRLLYQIAKLSCGYGEKWKNSVVFSISAIFLFAFIYMIAGIEVTNSRLLSAQNSAGDTYMISYLYSTGAKGLLQVIKDFVICVYFSTMTFTTVGYGNIITVNYIGILFSGFEMFFGSVMMSVMIGTIMRRLTR
jgi:Ion channel.